MDQVEIFHASPEIRSLKKLGRRRKPIIAVIAKKIEAFEKVIPKMAVKNNSLTYAPLDKQSEIQNFVFGFGCQPSHGVKTDTKMVSDICQAFLTRINRDTLICEVPAVFNGMKGFHNQHELVTSSTI